MIRPDFRLIILCCIVVLLSISCNKEKTQKVKIAVTTTDLTIKNINVSVSLMVNPESIIISEAKIDSTGKATLEFNIPGPTFAYFELGSRGVSLYLEPGYDLKVILDTIRDKTISFSGKGSEPNNYNSQISKIYKTFERKGFFGELTPYQFIARLDSLRNDFASFHLRYCDSTNLAKRTSRILELNNKLMLISFKQNFLLIHPIDSTSNDQYPEQLLNISKEIPFDDDLLSFRMDNYAMVLLFYLDLEIKKPCRDGNKGIKNIDELEPAIINDSILKNRKYTEGVREFLIGRNIYSAMKSSGLTPVLDSLFIGFKKSNPTSDYLPQLQKLADKCLAISPGSVAPDIIGTTVDGKSFSLNELKGKVVYIDVWATWCGPCREEFSFSKKIQQQFEKNDNVVFLFVSIDQDKAAWRKMVTYEKELKGMHINLNEEQIRIKYLIGGVPWYILIDHKGKIVNAKAARPSSGKVENEIRELLKKIKS